MYGYEKRYKLIVGSATDSKEYLLYHKYRGNNIKVKGGNGQEYYNAYHSHRCVVPGVWRERRLLLE